MGSVSLMRWVASMLQQTGVHALHSPQVVPTTGVESLFLHDGSFN